MSSPIVAATLQAAALNALSNLIAQVIVCRQSRKPISLNLTTLIQFVTLTIINTPPNFLWQQYLEASYPGVTPSSEARYLEQQQTSESGSAAYLGDLDVGNTVTKFLLDQSVGAVVNSIMFLAVIGALKGKSVSGIFRSVRQDFWPITSSGYKFWPLVSILCFTVVPVEKRIVVGSAFGVLWGIYLSLLAAK